MSVSNQGKSSDPFEIQTLCSFRVVGYVYYSWNERHRQLLELSLQDF